MKRLIALVVGVGENADRKNMQVTFANPRHLKKHGKREEIKKWISINHFNSINRKVIAVIYAFYIRDK